MNIDDFDPIFGTARSRYAAMEQLPDVTVFNFWRATDDDLARAEGALGVEFPEKYKEFMRRYGGGQFLFVDLLPVASPDSRTEDLLDVNQPSDSDFVAVAPVGTGDWWGFVCTGGVCEEQVSFMDHEDGRIEHEASDFLEFVARRGLRVGG